MMKRWIIDRLREPTTWIGLISFAAATGVSFAPELQDSIVTAGVAIGGTLAIVLKEKGDGPPSLKLGRDWMDK